MKPYKVCRKCGKEYKTEELFIAMTKFVGIQKFAPYNIFSLELRDCSCESTLARKLPMDEVQLAPAMAF